MSIDLVLDLTVSSSPAHSFFDTVKQAANEFTQSVAEKSLCIAGGLVFGGCSLGAAAGGSVAWITGPNKVSKELFLLSSLCSSLAKKCFAQILRPSVLPIPPVFQDVAKAPLAYESWAKNRAALEQISAKTEEEKALLTFLDQRWLAKSSGFIAFMVNWIHPLFGISAQIRPETSHAYARQPSNHLMENYQQRCTDWKKELPLPESFPLVLA